jgi:glycosyltransferase involved in cell wall biosynthesis
MRLVSLELWCPALDAKDGAASWRRKLTRDWPWILDDRRTRVEAWGLRRESGPSRDPLLSASGLVVPLYLPSSLALPLAWVVHFGLTLAAQRDRVIVAPTPYVGVGAAFALALRSRSSRPALVVRIMGSMPSKLRRVHKRAPLAAALEGLERWVLRRADLVVPMGGFTRRIAEGAGVPSDQIVELPFPTSWRGGDAPKPTAKGLLVVCAARLVAEKGIDTLLEAFARVLRWVPQARLEVVGDGPAKPSLQARARHLGVDGRVTFLGWCAPDEMPSVYSRALIGVLPSRLEEGLGMALVEAGLAGCALVGSDLGGIPDIVRPERNGLLVPPNDPEALAEALRALLINPEKAAELGRAAREDSLGYLARRDQALEELRRRVLALAEEA